MHKDTREFFYLSFFLCKNQLIALRQNVCKQTFMKLSEFRSEKWDWQQDFAHTFRSKAVKAPSCKNELREIGSFVLKKY